MPAGSSRPRRWFRRLPTDLILEGPGGCAGAFWLGVVAVLEWGMVLRSAWSMWFLPSGLSWMTVPAGCCKSDTHAPRRETECVQSAPRLSSTGSGLGEPRYVVHAEDRFSACRCKSVTHAGVRWGLCDRSARHAGCVATNRSHSLSSLRPCVTNLQDTPSGRSTRSEPDERTTVAAHTGDKTIGVSLRIGHTRIRAHDRV